jgi:hypothetical protein
MKFLIIEFSISSEILNYLKSVMKYESDFLYLDLWKAIHYSKQFQFQHSKIILEGMMRNPNLKEFSFIHQNALTVLILIFN